MTYTFYAAQTVPTNPTGPTPAQVVVTGAPTRGDVTFSVSGPNHGGTRGSLWCQTATAPYGYTQTIQLASFYIPPGAPGSQTQPYPLGDLSYYQFLFGNVDQIDGDGLTSATLTMTV